ncbi:MAG: hypothetical protein EVA97_00815 [SAR86 cluster bacterium]|uniref:DUF5916 domain-containing protein n=1 Tax=SAR86 cluster bacterium TaxID=2030880 RepID=A0A520N6K2_9GAMM|nr:MAG: hypothetical protein EVA97_00815 [SAR86 cluster bacterium]
MNKSYNYFFLLFSLFINAESIVIDANLDEPEWDTAITINQYSEVIPFTLQPAEERTVAKIFSNENGIYVGFTNFQANSTMLSNKSLRDEITNTADQNWISIDFDNDREKAYLFFVTLANIKGDGIRRIGGWPEFDWDGDWEVKTKEYDGYWVSEFLIPWNVALMKNVDGEERTINITTIRKIADKQSWIGDAETSARRTNFLLKLRPIQIKNYTQSKVNYFPYVSKTYNSVTGFNEDKIGAEIFISSGTGKQVNLTFNPDFGQAESDEVIVNFSAQETFYSEKRAFFNENQSLFDLSHYDRYRVINTRRIGAASTYDCQASYDEDRCDGERKSYTDIDFALRYTQKNDNSNVGIFVAQESDESFTKGKNFYALRSKNKIGTRTIGYFLTHVVDNFTNEKATVNVIDFINVKSDKLTLYTDFLSSEKEGVSGFGLRSQFVYKPTQLSRRSGSILYFEDSFRLNDFGYLKKNDWFHVGLGSDITKVDFNESSSVKERKIGTDFNYDSDTSGNSNPTQLRQEYNFQYKDTSSFQASWDLKTSGKNTTITRKNVDFPFVKRNGSFSFNLDYESPSYGSWEYDWRVGYETADKYKTWSSEGYERRFAKIAGSIYPIDDFKLGWEFRVREEDEWLNWIKDNELAVYDLTQKIISINANWFKGYKHEIRLKSQFVALEAESPISLISDKAGYLYNHNSIVKPFTDGITSFQVRYKYEIAPLSYIYLVYTKGGRVYDDENERNTSDVFKDPWENPDNEIFSLKFRLKY